MDQIAKNDAQTTFSWTRLLVISNNSERENVLLYTNKHLNVWIPICNLALSLDVK